MRLQIVLGLALWAVGAFSGCLDAPKAPTAPDGPRLALLPISATCPTCPVRVNPKVEGPRKAPSLAAT